MLPPSAPSTPLLIERILHKMKGNKKGLNVYD